MTDENVLRDKDADHVVDWLGASRYVRAGEGWNQGEWETAIATLQRDAGTLELSRYAYENARTGLSYAPGEIRVQLDFIFDSWISRNWHRFREDILTDALERFSERSGSRGEIGKLVSIFPPLGYEEQLVQVVLSNLSAARDTSDVLADLTALHGSPLQTAHFIDLALLGRMPTDDVAAVLDVWLPYTSRGRLLYGLWTRSQGGDDGERSPLSVARMLRQLPLRSAPPLDPFTLAGMSGSTRSTWRRNLAAMTAQDDELKAATTEALLWFAPNEEDLFAQYTAIEINASDPQAALEPLTRHPSHLVAARASSTLAVLANVPDPIEPFLIRGAGAPALRADLGPARTWLGDVRLEAMLRAAFHEASTSLAIKIRDTASGGEENLLAGLLTRLELKCEGLNERAAALARESGDDERLRIALSHRVVGKTEEGKPGLLPTGKFSADVTLVLRARKGDAPPFSERAVFIQAKRVRRGKEFELDHVEVDVQQMRHLADQTSSAFLLLLAPETLGITMPVVPAQLVIDRSGSAATRILHPDQIARDGRSLADWLVDDVIGLWTGDPDDAAVSKAEQGAGDRAIILVELEVALVPTRSPDPDR